MREVILPFWVNASYEEIKKIDLNFYVPDLTGDLISKGIVLQGPFLVSFTNKNLEIGVKDFPSKMLAFVTEGESKICFYEQGSKTHQIICSGRVSVSNDVIRIPFSGGDCLIRKVDRSDLSGLSVPSEAKKSIQILKKMMRNEELAENGIEPEG